MAYVRTSKCETLESRWLTWIYLFKLFILVILLILYAMEGNDENGHAELPRRGLSYHEHLGRPVLQWALGRSVRHCDYWRTCSYPDRVVLVIVDERKMLTSANRRAQTEIECLRAMMGEQGARIRELETSILKEKERTIAFRKQV